MGFDRAGAEKDCQITVPRCHRKTAARTDLTGKYGSPFSDEVKKSFGSVLVANGTDRAKNAGDTLFLSSANQAQKVAGLNGEAGIIIRQSTLLPLATKYSL